ncbi:MAG: hypothetical protein ABL986_06585 [Vicinamibacterales bacterium]
MKVLFSALHFANFRNYESAARALADRGHQVHLVAEEPESFGGQALVERLAAEYSNLTWGWMPSPASEPWFPFAQKIRYALDYVRFLAPEYLEAEKLRIRNLQRTPRVVRWATSSLGRAVLGQRAVLRALVWLEQRLPMSSAVKRYLEEQRPDVLLFTSLTVARSAQIHQIKAARSLGVRSAACILSWDHLSSKALLHVAPDRTLVWNDTQKTEAVQMHGLAAESVVVTGAQCYDQWFDRRPVRSREEFCRAMGLDPARRIVLYVCSAMSPVPDPVEPVFVREWVQALRSSADADLREAAVLVRPHPERVREWRGVTLDDLDHVVVSGRTPIDSEAKADYFDSLYYSDAVVGLCTSVFLEAAIVGRPVLTLLLPAFRMHQEGMAHFRYLLNVGGGLLHTATSLPAHLEQLGVAVRNQGARDARNRRFLEAFIRPEGLDVAATPRFVGAVESLASTPSPRPDQLFAAPSLATAWVGHLAAATQSGPGAWLMMDAIDIERSAAERDKAEDKDARAAARDTYRTAKATQSELAAQEKERERRRKSRARWWRGLSAQKQLARLKGSVKHLLGVRAQ